ncbi:hypothetical protein [Flexivirga oryzae]|uniref:Squalene cyclase C-terminal domain-containing protein n=1 Tax=Flexivirga oryzae TaxID=1794944 RepID=A0A839NGR0_9MICO|nr:hypothetical protein [Flexivirga oryzae]MBB2893851.1 hypothetical protein [Flexivirga oryzae]
MDAGTQFAVEWLLAAPEAAVRELSRHTLLGVPRAGEDVLSGPWVSALLAGQRADGGFGTDPYRKWTGAHWRLVALAQLGVPGDDPRVAAAAEHVLAWISADLRRPPPVVDGLVRSHASIHGNALGACVRLGLAGDERTGQLAEAIVSWQWPDGGWNCDHRASGRRSSFHESGCTAWGLSEYARATGDSGASGAVDRAVELFLNHRVFRRSGSGAPINARWLSTPYPSYWHYDLLSALLLIAQVGKATDPRAADALDLLETKRRPDGRWDAAAQWWRPSGSRVTPEVIDWGPAGEPNLMVTLNALRVLHAAGRLALMQ